MGWKKRDGKVHWGGDRLPGLADFVVLNHNYGIGGGAVWYQMYAIEGADPETFRVLGPNHGRDRQGVFFESSRVAEADPATFRSVGFVWGADAHQAFWRTQRLANANPETLTGLSPDHAKDDQHVFDITNVLADADPKSFVVLTDGYTKDHRHVWQHGILQTELNPDKFEVPQVVEVDLEAQAQSGDATAAFTLFEQNGEDGDHSRSLFWLHVARDLGHPNAADLLEDAEDWVPGWERISLAGIMLELARWYQDPKAQDQYLKKALQLRIVEDTNLTLAELKQEFPEVQALKD